MSSELINTMNRVRRILVILGALLLVLICASAVYAAEDNTPPELVDADVLNYGYTVKAGDPVKVKLRIKEEGAGLKEATVQIGSQDHGANNQQLTATKTWTTPVYSSGMKYIEYTFSIPTKASNLNGTWCIEAIYLYDSKDNVDYYIEDSGYGPNFLTSSFVDPPIHVEATELHFTMTGGADAPTPPVVNWVKIENPTVKKPDYLDVKVNITEEDNIRGIYVTFFKSTDHGKILEFAEYDKKANGTATYTVPCYIEANVNNGDWELYKVEVLDGNDNRTMYLNNDEGWLVSKEFPDTNLPALTIKVVGETGDETEPVLNSLRISDKSKVIKKPGMLEFTIDITEEETGVKYMRVSADSIVNGTENYSDSFSCEFVAKKYKDEYTDYGSNRIPKVYDAPLKTGTYTFRMPIESKVINGDYLLTIAELVDGAGNSRWGYSYPNPDNWEEITDEFHIMDEFEYKFETGIANPKLLDRALSLEDGEVGRVILDTDKENNVVSKDVLDAIAGQDRTLVFYKSGYQWIMNGLQLDPEKTKDLDLNVKIRTVKGENLSSGQDAICLTFSNNGELPGTIQFRFKSAFVEKYTENPEDLYLYYVEEETGEETGIEDDGQIDYLNDDFEEVEGVNFDVVTDNDDTWCYVDISHNSKYLVSGAKLWGLTMADAKVSGVSSAYTYTGRAIKPSFTAKLAGRTLKAGTDYSVKYLNNRAIGKASIVLTGKTVKGKKTLTFKVRPRPTTMSGVTALSKGFTAKWNMRIAHTSGYQLQYALNSKFTSGAKIVTINKKTTVSKKVTKLKPGRKYYVRVRVYKLVDGKKIYSAWSKAMTVTTKK